MSESSFFVSTFFSPLCFVCGLGLHFTVCLLLTLLGSKKVERPPLSLSLSAVARRETHPAPLSSSFFPQPNVHYRGPSAVSAVNEATRKRSGIKKKKQTKLKKRKK